MRSLRLFLLVALVALAGTLYGIYKRQRGVQRGLRPNPPAPLPLDTKASALDYEWGQSDSGRPRVRVIAHSYKQASIGDKVQLVGLQLQIFNKEGSKYDLIRSPHADFDQSEGKLYSPGECEITLDVPDKGKPEKALTVVKTSGISFDSKTGFATTDRNTAFSFQGGTGVSTGASYDPEKHELHLMKSVVLNLAGEGAQSKKMKVETDELTYKESEQTVVLSPWSRMTRDFTVIDAKNSTIKIRDKVVDWIDAQSAHGSDKEPRKQLEYAADLLHVKYNDYGEMEKLEGTGNARLVSHAPASNTTITGARVDLFFTSDASNESELTSAAVNGNGRVETVPLDDSVVSDPKVPDPKLAKVEKDKTGDTKIITAEVMDLRMKPGGKDLDRVQTHAPSVMEFVPHQASRHRRLVKGARMSINYGDHNQIASFHTTDASTETFPSEEERKRKKADLAVAYTSSKNMDASFDEKGQLKEIHQQDNFRYTEGERKAQADEAIFDNTGNVMHLDRHARMSDSTGSTVGDKIDLQQTTGDFRAMGHVSTTRVPEEPDTSGKQRNSSMLDDQEPMQGTADLVDSANHNKMLHYVGNAVVWQTGNRITADRVDIDREKKRLVADGQVVTQFLDSDKKDPAADQGSGREDNAKPAPGNGNGGKAQNTKAPSGSLSPKQPIYTIVRAKHMVYTDEDRLAVYNGDVSFARPTLTVKSDFLKAYLNDKDSDEDSRVNHAFSDGKVVILETSLDRQRVGSSEHAEYYTDEGKIILTGGSPRLDDPKKGNTVGEKLTYFTDDERLEVYGAKQTPVKSHLHRRKS